MKTIAVLTEQECQRFADQVLKLKDHWTHRLDQLKGVKIELSTLGRATYLDGFEGQALARNEINQILWENFKDLYHIVCEKLTESLGRPVMIDQHYILPGFHVVNAIEALPGGVDYGGMIHADTQHESAQFPFEFSEIFSFTLPLLIPQNGTGLNYWTDSTRELKYLPYKLGEMVTHSCTTLHQMANPEAGMQPGEYRITLQGHGVLKSGGQWLIYF